VIVVAGKIGDVVAPDPAPDSWAADPANEVAMWRIKMEAGAQWKLPAASPEVRRTLYFYKGSQIRIAGLEIDPYQAIQLLADQEVIIDNGGEEGFMLLLQGLPIAEPVAQHGPFVMNTQEEIHQAISDYRSTQFGGWPWPRHDNVHDRKKGRFAKYANGKEEQK
jgi:quercetin 2,3-dioxygenase